MIEAEKLKAIGLGNRVDSEREVRKRKQLELQAMINEKKAELERLSAQHDSLTSVELQQKALIDNEIVADFITVMEGKSKVAPPAAL